MARYIDIDKFKKWTMVYVSFCGDKDCIDEGIICDECYYEHGGAEDVAPVVHAKWEWSYDEDEYVCSNCKHWCAGTRFEGDSFLTPYCPFCSAKMEICEE